MENNIATSLRLQIAKAKLVATDGVEVCLLNNFNQQICETTYMFGGNRSVESILTAAAYATLELIQLLTPIQDIFLDELEVHTLDHSNLLTVIAVVKHKDRCYYGISKLEGDNIDELLLSSVKCVLSCCNRLLERFIPEPQLVVNTAWTKRKVDVMRDIYDKCYPRWEQTKQDYQPVIE